MFYANFTLQIKDGEGNILVNKESGVSEQKLGNICQSLVDCVQYRNGELIGEMAEEVADIEAKVAEELAAAEAKAEEEKTAAEEKAKKQAAAKATKPAAAKAKKKIGATPAADGS